MSKSDILGQYPVSHLYDWTDTSVTSRWSLSGTTLSIGSSDNLFGTAHNAFYYEFTDTGLGPDGIYNLWALVNAYSGGDSHPLRVEKNANGTRYFSAVRSTNPLGTTTFRHPLGAGQRQSIALVSDEAARTVKGYFNGEHVGTVSGYWYRYVTNTRYTPFRLYRTDKYIPRYFGLIRNVPITDEDVWNIYNGDGESYGIWTGVEEDKTLSIEGMWDGNTIIPVTPEIT